MLKRCVECRWYERGEIAGTRHASVDVKHNVPFVIWQSKPSQPGDPVAIFADDVQSYNEDAAAKGALGLMKDDEFIRFFLGETLPVPSSKRIVK